METLEEFMKSQSPKRFRPLPFYCAESDSLTFYFKDEAYLRERIDDFLTVYRSRSNNHLVGCQVKGIPRALETIGNFGLTIDDKVVKLSMIFMALATISEAPQHHFYLELGKAASGTEIFRKDIAPALESLGVA